MKIPSRPLQIGVIGAGRMGKIHIMNIQHQINDAIVMAIATAHPNTKTWLDDYPNIRIVDDYQKLLAMDNLDAVVIASPSNQHAEQVIASIHAGKHIFCEKPLSFDMPTYQKIMNLTKSRKIHLQIGFNRQFDPNFLKLKQHIINGDIGQPHILRITSRDPHLPSFEYLKQSGGMLYDQTIHDFRMALHLIDSSVIEVFAQGDTLIDTKLKQINDIDTVIITLKFANGCLGVIDNSRQAIYGYDQRIEVFGNKGSCFAENNFPTVVEYFNSTHVQQDLPYHFFLERYQQSFLAEMQAFVTAIQQDQMPVVTVKDGLQTLKLIKAAYQSMHSQQSIQL